MTDSDMTNVADMIAHHAEQRPWAVAILDDTRTIHYGALDKLVWAAAWHLRKSGIMPGDLVGIALPHSALHLVAVYALARLGAMSIALPLSDPQPLRQSLARRFNVGSVLALSDNAGPPGVATVLVTWEHLAEAPAFPQRDLRSPGGDLPWYIRRTSGTTGEPKGIARSHRQSLTTYRIQAAHYCSLGHRILAILDMATAFGFSVAERGFYGGSTVVVSPLSHNAQDFLRSIDLFGITHVFLTANYLSALLQVLPAKGHRAPGLIQLLVSGMALTDTLREEITQRFTLNLINLYGSNETQGITLADHDAQQRFPGTVGQAMAGVELEIVDESDNPLPPGQSGRIRVRSDWLSSGYFNAPQEANGNFRDGWVYLGDIGMMSAEGMLFLRGRIDDMINFDGLKILPSDIEDALLSHPAVLEAVAFPLASSVHHHLPAAAVILRQPASREELFGHCRKHLGVRAPLIIGIENDFPRNPGGKVLRTELAAKLSPLIPVAIR
jgi:long-chain acyl-CoA synthetase